MITQERWLQAQAAERRFHSNESFGEGLTHYGESYEQYFKCLDIDNDLQGKNICEIGPADFPALGYCKNRGDRCLIIEPMPSDYLKSFGIPVMTDPAEYAIYNTDEVWLMNVLQHVLDPYKIVEQAKKQSKVIRFFEPINYGVNECHPWNLTKEMFEEWFPRSVKIWEAGQNVKNFHTWECAYGVWLNQ